MKLPKSAKFVTGVAFALACAFALAAIPHAAPATQPPDAQARAERFRTLSRNADQRLAEEPFVGVTTSGTVQSDLFELRSTGVSTEPVRRAAQAFLTSLSDEQRSASTFLVDDLEWRKWMNQHFYQRQGVRFADLSTQQRDAAFALLGASLSAKGVELSRDIMRLNHTLGELTDDFEEFGEGLYHLTFMGAPSPTEPWGWQLDGHHLILNYFVLADQVVLSPMFLGSEPVRAEAGKYRGTQILQREQAAGLALLNALAPPLREAAILSGEKTGNNNLVEALQDNLVLDYAGVPAARFDAKQRRLLLELIGLFVGNLREGHAAVRMQEVQRHLAQTHFAWIGGTSEDSVYYYRIHSPVILIEFDHQRPANLRHLMPPVPSHQHIHVVVRTPNGNDYGKDLLRQHLATHPH